MSQVGHLYAGVEFDAEEVGPRVEAFGVHEWNPTRFGVPRADPPGQPAPFLWSDSAISTFPLTWTISYGPVPVRELVALNLPIVAPFLRSIGPGDFYSNYHSDIDANGYYRQCDQYFWILNRWIRGVQEVPVVNSTYLVRADKISALTYDDRDLS